MIQISSHLRIDFAGKAEYNILSKGTTERCGKEQASTYYKGCLTLYLLEIVQQHRRNEESQ